MNPNRNGIPVTDLARFMSALSPKKIMACKEAGRAKALEVMKKRADRIDAYGAFQIVTVDAPRNVFLAVDLQKCNLFFILGYIDCESAGWEYFGWVYSDRAEFEKEMDRLGYQERKLT